MALRFGNRYLNYREIRTRSTAARDAEEIKKLQLGPCIDDFVANDKVKQVAKRAAWIGNDETHYVRKWADKDLEYLKALIQLTVNWIEMEETTKKILAEMPKGKK